MNVMLTCIGGRTYLVNAFKRALNGHGQVLVCDCAPVAAAFDEADGCFVVPRVDEEAYVDTLLALCKKHRIELLIPALEPELRLLAKNRERFSEAGTIALVSSVEIIDTCYDKLNANSFLIKHGLAVAPTFTTLEFARNALSRGELSFPLVVKPRWGVSSIATRFPEDEQDLEDAYALARKEIARSFLAEISSTDSDRAILIQQRLFGDEYGLDVVNDLDGPYICTFARRKVRTRLGPDRLRGERR